MQRKKNATLTFQIKIMCSVKNNYLTQKKQHIKNKNNYLKYLSIYDNNLKIS